MAGVSSTSSKIDRSDLPVLPTEWRWVQFSETCDRVSVGHVGPTTEFFTDAPDGICFIRSQNVRPGKLELWNALSITPEFHKKLKKSQLRAGDILFVRVGANRGDCCVVPSGINELNCANIVFARPKHPTGFHAYFFQSELGRNLLLSASVGAAQGVINTGSVATMPVPLPSLLIQQRIAGILSTYDELIENSQRRIKILESMARALYREWFVHFRFPGHEQHPCIASPLGEIPQGWEVKKLRDIISAHIGGGWGKEVQDEDHTEPAWVIRGTDIPGARYSQIAGVPYRVHTASNLRSRKLAVGDIVFEVSGGSKGQPVGRSMLITSELLSSFGCDVICASFCKRIQPDLEGYGSELLYLSFLEGYESGEIEQYQVQSTGISNFKWTEYIASTDRVVPPKDLREQFRGYVAPLLVQIATLGRKIENLRVTRDRLLPRLLAGQSIPADSEAV